MSADINPGKEGLPQPEPTPVVGRRIALRLLTLGAGSALLSACAADGTLQPGQYAVKGKVGQVPVDLQAEYKGENWSQTPVAAQTRPTSVASKDGYQPPAATSTPAGKDSAPAATPKPAETRQVAPASQTGDKVDGLPRKIQAFPNVPDRLQMDKLTLEQAFAKKGTWHIRLIDPSLWNAQNGWRGAENFSVARLIHPSTEGMTVQDFGHSGSFEFRLEDPRESGLLIAGLHFINTWTNERGEVLKVGDQYRQVSQPNGSRRFEADVPVATHIRVQGNEPVGLYQLKTGELEVVQKASRDGDIALDMTKLEGTPVALGAQLHNSGNEARFQGRLWNGTLDKWKVGLETNQFEAYRTTSPKK